MGLFKSSGKPCRDLQIHLEDAARTAHGAKSISEFAASMPGAWKEHAATCADCRAAAENILETRALLAEMPSHGAMAAPWFAPRVLAAIAARKAELSRAADTWTFLPKLAARLTWASSIALLLASAWLYQRPATMPATATSAKAATDIVGDPVVEPATQSGGDDEFLLSLAEKQHR